MGEGMHEVLNWKYVQNLVQHMQNDMEDGLLQEYAKISLTHLDLQERPYVHSETSGVFSVSFNTSRTAW